MVPFKLSTLGLAFFNVLHCITAQDTPTDTATTGNYVDKIFVDKCLFPTHKSWTDAQKEALWKLGPLMGKRFTTTDAALARPDDQPVYTYNVGVCTGPTVDADPKSYTAATQHEGTADTGTTHVLGQLNDTSFMTGTDWAMLEYRSGQRYGSHCTGEQRRTLLMIICDPYETEGKLQIIEENNMKDAGCFYLFELSHSAACSIQQTGLSVGSIICIVVLCVVAVYLIGGVLYQRFIAGAKGIEQIPHLHFWRDFGNLQADGCDLLCRGGYQRSSRTYRGVGDDQLSSGREETLQDDDRDDHLLPM